MDSPVVKMVRLDLTSRRALDEHIGSAATNRRVGAVITALLNRIDRLESIAQDELEQALDAAAAEAKNELRADLAFVRDRTIGVP